MGDQNDGDAGGSGQSSIEKIKVGDKEYTSSDIESILAQTKGATEAQQALAKVQQLAGRYGMDIENFLQNAEGSFAAVSDLMDQGIIDAQGNLVTPKGKEDSQAGDDIFTKLLGKQDTGDKGGGAMDEGRTGAMLKGLATEVSGLKELLTQSQQEIASLRQDNNVLLRTQIISNLRTSVKGLENVDEEDINSILARASADKTKGLKEHAEAFVARRNSLLDLGKQELAKTLGIEDLSKHLNDLRQQESGGDPGQMFEGKKISFKPGKDAVHPRDATREFLNRTLKD